jgi:RNA polymerase sigma-70 factor (sigma-E family)
MAAKETFDDYVVARERHLLRVAYLLTHDVQLAEDLVQTALTRAWFAWGRVEGDPDPYVRRILVNTFASSRRRRWLGERPTADLPDRAVAATEPPTDVRRALAALPPRQRAVIVLRFFEDLTEADTAAALGVSLGTVKSQTATALARLRVDPRTEVDR